MSNAACFNKAHSEFLPQNDGWKGIVYNLVGAKGEQFKDAFAV